MSSFPAWVLLIFLVIASSAHLDSAIPLGLFIVVILVVKVIPFIWKYLTYYNPGIYPFDD